MVSVPDNHSTACGAIAVPVPSAAYQKEDQPAGYLRVGSEIEGNRFLTTEKPDLLENRASKSEDIP